MPNELAYPDHDALGFDQTLILALSKEETFLTLTIVTIGCCEPLAFILSS